MGPKGQGPTRRVGRIREPALGGRRGRRGTRRPGRAPRRGDLAVRSTAHRRGAARRVRAAGTGPTDGTAAHDRHVLVDVHVRIALHRHRDRRGRGGTLRGRRPQPDDRRLLLRSGRCLGRVGPAPGCELGRHRGCPPADGQAAPSRIGCTTPRPSRRLDPRRRCARSTSPTRCCVDSPATESGSPRSHPGMGSSHTSSPS